MRGAGGLARSGASGFGAALLGAVLLADLVGGSTIAAAQGVPLPQPAPKRNIPARPPASDTRPPTPVRPAESIPYDGSQKALVDRVSNYLSSVQVLSGDFVQIAPDGRRSTGKFYIQKPGKVRFEYEPPSPIDVVADGTSVVVRNLPLNTQDVYALSQTPLRFLLADQIDLLRDTNVVATSRDANFVTVTVEERQLLVGTSRLVLMFNARDMQLRQWTVTDPQGYDTTVAVSNLDSVHKPDPNLFKIIYERLLQ
jgi:outer membrane lipoprotein-sorting protein